MNDTDPDQLLFSSLIEINYDRRFIRIAQNFVERLSELAGASQSESLQVSLLVEECLAFIINKYIDCRVSAHIELCFKVTADKTVRIDIIDIGPPIHEHMIPSFDITDERSDAGLWYKLVRGLSDEFAFMNQLKDGWRLHIAKKIERITFSASGNGHPEAGALAERDQTLGEKHTRSATVADIPAIIDLAYMTYRYSYIFKELYDGKHLKTQIEEQRCDIRLIEHGRKVIGACAFKYSDAQHRWAELGSAMIAPEYRNSRASALIMREVNDYVRANPYHCEFFMSHAMTTHIRSQKMLGKVHQGFKPLMLGLNMAPRPEFIGLNHQRGGRESGLCVYHPNDPLKVPRLYTPSIKHLEIIQALIANLGSAIEIVPEFSAPENQETGLSIQQQDSVQFAKISVESLGPDWFTALSKKIFTAIVSGIESVVVTLPASRPLPRELDRMLTDLNLIFCGLSLQSLERLDYAYCLSTQPVDFSRIQLYEPVAQKLLLQMEQSYYAQGHRSPTP